MRVCHVITKPELGGAQLSTLNILSSLPRDEYDVSIITSPKGILAPDFRNFAKVKSYFCPFLIRAINPLYDIIAFIQIYRIYSCNKYNLVHTHSSKAGIVGRWAARFARVPIIIHTVHGWSFNDYQPLLLKRLYIFLEKLTARFTTKIICVSKRDLETGVKYRIGARDKFVFIRYGMMIDEFQKSSKDVLHKRAELGIYNNGPVVGMIACLKPQKSPLDFVKASIKIYKKMPNVNFLLIGDGALRKKCERLLANTPLNGRFIFAGWRRDVSEILDILDVVVLTSKWEGMPISIIEALSKGRIVVATRAGGTPEIVKDGITGFLTEAGAYEEIAEKVLKILKDPQSLDKMKQDAFLSIDDSFRLDRMVNDISNLYRSLS